MKTEFVFDYSCFNSLLTCYFYHFLCRQWLEKVRAKQCQGLESGIKVLPSKPSGK